MRKTEDLRSDIEWRNEKDGDGGALLKYLSQSGTTAGRVQTM